MSGGAGIWTQVVVCESLLLATWLLRQRHPPPPGLTCCSPSIYKKKQSSFSTNGKRREDTVACKPACEASNQWISNHCHPQVWARITLLPPGFLRSCRDNKVSDRTLNWVWNQQRCDLNWFCSLFAVTLPEGNKIASGFQTVGFCFVLFFQYRGMTRFLSHGGIIGKWRKMEDLTFWAYTRGDKEPECCLLLNTLMSALDAFQRTRDLPTTLQWNIWKPK